MPSPKVATYDLKPEMSASEVTDKLVDADRRAARFDLIVVNYANTDMVGHTGDLDGRDQGGRGRRCAASAGSRRRSSRRAARC